MEDTLLVKLRNAKFPPLIVSNKGHKWLETGHLWLYANDINCSLCNNLPAELKAYKSGELVDVYSEKAKYLGTGFYNDKSKIAVRILSSNRNERFEASFWQRRVSYALAYRLQIGLLTSNENTACRLIYGEADGFPGLTCDLFADVLSIEIFSLGMAKIWPLIQEILLNELKTVYKRKIRIVYEKSLGQLRAKEGLSEFAGPRYSSKYSLADERLETELKPVLIVENGIKMEVDFVHGQKTGYFLDQRDNRLYLQKLAKDKQVLECFTHTGSFALNAVAGGASSVLAVDISETALKQAEQNAKLNAENLDLTHLEFLQADVFQLLTALVEHKSGPDWNKARAKGPFNMILLDPPAFAKRKEVKQAAYKGYLQINYQAMRLLPRGGYLVTTSCSHFIPDADFFKMLQEAASKANVSLRLIARREQAADHPILLNMPETAYLKTYFLQIV
ncbi:class I SAM-dependent rRNA methyltransferase [Amygdalobacter nucleatus]|uniref:23S rRNA methyltransferase family protein n=1 Tax=Amygdalobacter nucleatus TaxID=3029274 RepID=A0A133YCQ0_9FIRM|nr:class I SAM-dependent rRNA methyltransferase [Amygdalobacter nucleatus]KXB40975.1 23S rRNA methyltransferase family protein [Amygdalobacter nucleatus]MDF0485893.1 class I SAM-dependent rRNA methyltransferase [Amygdalobacter nucleatus]